MRRIRKTKYLNLNISNLIKTKFSIYFKILKIQIKNKY